MKYVAVVATNSDISGREQGDFACFIGPTKQNVITRAMRAREKWGTTASHYRILVGRITEEAEMNARYTLTPLKPEVKRG